jgi:putative ABC transport system permease protein
MKYLFQFNLKNMSIRFLKVIRDIASDYSKNSMLVVSIAIGVFGIGTILGAYSVLNREMVSNYAGTNPASATIEINSPISQALLDSVKIFPGIKNAERHATVSARMKVGDKWYPMLLFVIDDFSTKQINKINYDGGKTNPADGTMLVERTALVVMQAEQGATITVKTANGKPTSLKIVGTVHDPGLAPAWQEQCGYGYISLSTLKMLGELGQFDQLRILVEDDPFNRTAIIKEAEELSVWLENHGCEVHQIQVPPPGKHPHQSQMTAVLSIFIIFSFLILILGSILVATSVATLMVKQVRQIGVMKTIGANSNQIGSQYLVMILILCGAALILSVPASRIAAPAFYIQIAVLLNLNIVDTTIPHWVPILQITSGIVIPLIAAGFPVLRGSRVSVRTALDNYGVNVRAYKQIGGHFLSSLFFLNDTFKLSIRNVFRQRSRLIMTLGLLAAGGAMFMTALNVAKAWEENLNRIYTQRLYDLEVRLNDRVESGPIISQLNDMPGVSTAEAWDYAPTSFFDEHAHEITYTYPDKGHGSFTMLALPQTTKLFRPMLSEGIWLTDETKNQVVLNQMARGLVRDLKLGDTVKLSLDGENSEWVIVGFTEDVGSGATAYVSINTFEQLKKTVGKTKMLRISYDDRSKQNAMTKNSKVEALLESENISVGSTIPVWLLHNAIAAHMKVLVNSLMAMAVLMAIVGTLGLTSTMSMSIMERTREIGVMRTIGGTPRKIKNIVVWEGISIGVMSIALAFILSLILSTYMGKLIGNMAFKTPLSLSISGIALLSWLVIILVGSFVATFFPARRAGSITIREALAYE